MFQTGNYARLLCAIWVVHNLAAQEVISPKKQHLFFRSAIFIAGCGRSNGICLQLLLTNFSVAFGISS